MAECLAAEVEVFGLGGKEKVCLYQELENGGVGLFKGVENPRYGNLVGWDIRVIWAREPSLRGLVKDSLDRVFELLTESNVYIRQGVDLDLWKARSQTLKLLIVDLMVELGDFRTASNILKGVIASSSSSHGSGKKDVDVCSALVRIELQLGNVVEAAKWINVIELELCQNPSTTLTSQLPSTDFARRDVVLINRALYAISSAGDWNQAAIHLTELLEYSQSNSIPTQQKSIISIPVIVNNISVCYLYSGNVGQALSHLESLVLEMPQLCGGSASLLFNLATLYDLTDNSLERKRRLLGGVVAAHAGDDLDGACLKLAQ
ncbi:hypothetical protein BDR26DRAFT_890254 [Obelidium mucronatum]|nr:hypothetical protein BDR26DRAFT_890254 [Obelidium mucronatum]